MQQNRETLGSLLTRESLKNSSELKRRVGEGVAILVSILLAFGIDAAWQDRADRAEESRILSALHDEFLVNQTRVAEAIAFHSALKSAGFSLLEAARPGAPTPTVESVDDLIANFTWWGGFFVFESASLDAVILGGRLDVIENEDLRRLLTGWRGSLEQTARQEAPEFIHYNEVWLPILRRRANLAQIGNASTTQPGSDEPYLWTPVPEPITGHFSPTRIF